MDNTVGTVKGTAYPLSSKRLKLQHIQHLARALDLPAAAPRSDLEVMITGRIAETRGEEAQVQVIISLTEEGELVSLRDMEGTFLIAPPLPALPSRGSSRVSRRASSMASSMVSTSSEELEDLDIAKDLESLAIEVTQLRNLLQVREEESGALSAKLELMRGEIDDLKAELSIAQDRILELWQENCEQLIQYDNAMSEKDKELQLLREQLQVRELELARLKLSSLERPEILSDTAKLLKEESVSLLDGKSVSFPTGIARDNLPGGGLQRSPDVNFTCYPTTMASTTPEQHRGQTFVPVAPLTTTTTTSLPLGHVTTTSADILPVTTRAATSNPFQQPWPLPTSCIPTTTQGQLNKRERSGFLGSAYEQSLPSTGQEVTNISASLSDALSVSRPINSIGIANCSKPATDSQTYSRRGKAPPIDPFNAEEVTVTFEDWLLTLERAAQWNEWTTEESLMQLAGYLRGRAAQQWKLLQPERKRTYQAAIAALKERLDPGNHTLAALDFRHISQHINESVSDFIGRLEQVFQTGFGREQLSNETREMLLFGQLQEGLLYTLMEAPSVSGAQNYKELCLAAKREERRLNELKKKQHYLKNAKQSIIGSTYKQPTTSRSWHWKPGNRSQKDSSSPVLQQKQRRCYICDSPNHLAWQCQQPKTESSGKKSTQTKSSSSRPGANVIRATPHSHPKCGSRSVEVNIEGIPITGVIDTGSDITILRGDQFYNIVSKAGLNVQDLEVAEQIRACTYDQKPIRLDGQMKMSLSFSEKAIVTTVYIKLVAPDELLLSEEVCHLLGIVSYHPSVKSAERCQPTSEEKPLKEKKEFPISINEASISDQSSCDSTSDKIPVVDMNQSSDTPAIHVLPDAKESESKLISSDGYPPSNDVGDISKTQPARVKLITAVRLPAYYSAAVPVEVEAVRGHVLIESEYLPDDCLSIDDSLVNVNQEGRTTVIVSNNSKTPYQLKSSIKLACASEVEVESTIEKSQLSDQKCCFEDDATISDVSLPSMPESLQPASGQLNVWTINTLSNNHLSSNEHIRWRQQQLRGILIKSNRELSDDKSTQLSKILSEYHDVFSLSDDERGETDLVEFKIDTGDSQPRKQPVRRVPFGARQEIADQLNKMQQNNVIQPSESPWASPVVLVRKRDGTLRFCVDYRALNSLTKPDLFPLPRINDLLDQLGKSKYFSTLDLKSGYWQIKVSDDSQEKTAFITHKGLFEFRVMPFGVTNAPAVFQRLMQRVLSGLQTSSTVEFVSVYLDDVIVFSETLQDHIKHLRAVFDRLRKAGLMLNPSKCKLLSKEVEYLGHIVTPCGLQPNNRNLEAVRNFPQPTTLKQLRQFLGLTSYYRRFIPGYAKVAHPLHALTRKGAVFSWSAECEVAFESLRVKLSSSPLLAYPDFTKDFTLETDASKLGLGAILSQYQDDLKLHPVAYASRSISNAEANYAITDLETLAVVWAVTHFRYYLYGHNVIVFTDHAAVRAILGAPNLTGRHARWWSKVYGSGIKHIDIIHRSGKKNPHADCLSRQPVMAAPSDKDSNTEVQVAAISCELPATISDVLQEEPREAEHNSTAFCDEQMKDPELSSIILYLRDGTLPGDATLAKKIVAESTLYALCNNVLYFVGPKQTEISRVVVPQHLRHRIMQEHHDGPLAGHFSGPKLYKSVIRCWWWPHMYTDVMKYADNCPQCAIVEGTGRRQKPLLQPIATERPFQILGVDIMELPVTTRGNRYVIVFQDLFTKWPMVFPAPDQKTERIARLLVEEIVPCFGVPEAVLSDRGTNLLSYLMKDVCRMLGIEKLNTTANHPQCNGAIERFNRTLKTMLRKHAAKFGMQWDQYLSGVLWAYRNTPHSSTGEKPSFLLYGFDCRTPTEAALLPTRSLKATNLNDYREQMVLSLSTARNLAKEANKISQKRYKTQYDKSAKPSKSKVGDWVLIYFSQDETGKNRKLSQPWHGPYRIVSQDDPDVVVTKIYFPDDPAIQVHQSRVQPCPPSLPTGFFWYGNKRSKPGRPPKKVLKQLENLDAEMKHQSTPGPKIMDRESLPEPTATGTFPAESLPEPSQTSSTNPAEVPPTSASQVKEVTSTDTTNDEHRYFLRSRKKPSAEARVELIPARR